MAPTVQALLSDIRDTISEYTNKWLIFAHKMARAYDAAYEGQARLLRRIQKAIEARKERDDAMMVFALSLLTVGIVGPIAKRFVKKLTSNGTSKTIGDLVGKAAQDPLLTEWFQDTFGAVAKKGTEKLQDLGLAKLNLMSPPPGDAFTPAGLTPTSYGHLLEQGILERAEVFSDLARGFYEGAVLHNPPTFNFTPAMASRIRDGLRQSSFITDVPGQVDENVLTAKAKLALWVAWAHVRDEAYWRKASHGFNPEVRDFAPVRDELVNLGVPAREISVTPQRPYGFDFDDMHTLPHLRVQGLNVDGLIKWAKSPLAISMLFQNLPMNAAGRAQVPILMLSKPL